MHLETTIRQLSSRDLRTVISAFPEVVKDKLKTGYQGDPVAWEKLQQLDEAQAALILEELIPQSIEGRNPSDDDLRQFLLALAEHSEYEPYLRSALERRLLVSIDPVTMGYLLVLILSVKWKFKIKRTKEAKVEIEFEVSKNATPNDFLKKLLARMPGFGDAPA